MDLTTKTDIELKAISYDIIVSNENNNKALQMIAQELQRRAQQPESPVVEDQIITPVEETEST